MFFQSFGVAVWTCIPAVSLASLWPWDNWLGGQVRGTHGGDPVLGAPPGLPPRLLSLAVTLGMCVGTCPARGLLKSWQAQGTEVVGGVRRRASCVPASLWGPKSTPLTSGARLGAEQSLHEASPTAVSHCSRHSSCSPRTGDAGSRTWPRGVCRKPVMAAPLGPSPIPRRAGPYCVVCMCPGRLG